MFAEKTSVPVWKTKVEIEALLNKQGAEQFLIAGESSRGVIQFRAKGRLVKFEVVLPDATAKEFIYMPGSSYRKRTIVAARNAYEQACRQKWRALLLVIKAKLEAVESKITTFDEEFYPYIVMPGANGKTVFELTSDRVAAAYQSNQAVPLLPGW